MVRDVNMIGIIYDIDIAKDVKSFLISNTDVIDIPNNLKSDILGSDDNDLLRVGKTIDSPINIVSVDKVDPDFFKNNLFKDGDQD